MTFALKSHESIAERQTLAVGRSPVKLAFALTFKSFWLLVWIMPGALHRGTFETLLLAALTAKAILSVWEFARPLLRRQPLLILGCNGIQDPRYFRFPMAWIRIEGCAFHASLFETRLRLFHAHGHIDIDLTLAPAVDAELAFKACAESVEMVRSKLPPEARAAKIVREFPRDAALPIGPAAVAMATGIAAGFVIAGFLGLLNGLV